MTIDIIIVRLLPNPPTDATTFQKYIENLSIEAYDQNLVDVDTSTEPTGANEVLLGTASGLLTFADKELWDTITQRIEIPNPEPGHKKKLPKSIIQHTVKNVPSGIPPAPAVGILRAVATAVIVVDIQPADAAAAHKEYATYDVRLALKRNGVAVEAPPIEWNATRYKVGDLSPYATDYMGISINPVLQEGFPSMAMPSTYALIPAAPTPLPPGTAAVLLDQDGNPPPFDQLRTAVNLVLDKYNLDAGTKMEALDPPLTEAQSREIASEIVYNRAWYPLPLPIPLFPPPVGSPVLEDLYTSPGTNNDMTRTKFEGSLAAYHAKLDADARRLASYIFAASAAVAAERMSARATVALLTFPLDPRMSPSTQSRSSATSSQTTAQLSVVLTSWDAFSKAPPSNASTLDPSFVVPAAYFYALGYQLSSSMTPELRYRAMVNSTPEFISTTINAAVGEGILAASESAVTQAGNPGGNFSVNTAQAIRRMCALLPNVVNMLGGLTSSGTSASAQLPGQPVLHMSLVSGLVKLWRDFDKQDAAFWTTSRFDDASYLNLILQITASGDLVLKPAIASAQLVPPSQPGGPSTVIGHASDLPRITTEAWKGFFLSGTNPPPLPAWTAPGDNESRVEAFVRRLQMLFSVAWQAPGSSGGTVSVAVPVLDTSVAEFIGLPAGSGSGAGDVLAVFLQSAQGFSFEGDWDESVVNAGLLDAFPDPSLPHPSSFGDDGAEQLRRWLKAALKALWTLVRITNLPAATDINPLPKPLDPYRRFAYMEALYSRGFVSADGIAVLTATEFAAGLSGTIIERGDIPAIHDIAVKLPHSLPNSGSEPGWGFMPANPGGAEALVNCIPAPTLDPLGRVAYLHEMLRLTLRLDTRQSSGWAAASQVAANDEAPVEVTDSTKAKTLQDLIAARRGDIGNLCVRTSNLETQIPVTDLVLESLEALGAWVFNNEHPEDAIVPPGGIVHDATSNPAADLLGLCASDEEDDTKHRDGDGNNTRREARLPPKDPCCVPGLPSSSELLAAIPQYSHPAIRVSQPWVYHKLQSTFTSPALPFARHLDITRSYLSCVGTRRFDTMRHFRQDITEFPLDPDRDPPQFQAHAWRLPVRIDIGLEYIGLSRQEYVTLYRYDIDAKRVAGLYGLQLSELWWGYTALTLSGFMEGLGLTYCEVLKLKDSGYIKFDLVTNQSSGPHGVSAHTHAGSGGDTAADAAPIVNSGNSHTSLEESREPAAPLGDPDCPPCCLDNWHIIFPGAESKEQNEVYLKQLAIFVRLWRTLNAGCHHKLSLRRLADICTVLQLFGEKKTVNYRLIRELVALLMLIDFFGLPWSDDEDTGEDCLLPLPPSDTTPPPPGSARTKILALWDPKVSRGREPSPAWDWAVSAMINAVQSHAEREYHSTPRNVDSPKIIAENLDRLAKLAGFSLDPDRDPSWHANPVCTIRFAEVLSKICASRFTVGELLFLFTVEDHVDGEDPFPIAPLLETASHPLSSLPDDELEFNLETLRKKLLRAAEECESAALEDEECDALDWSSVEAIIRNAGYTSFSTSDEHPDDALQSLAEYFFPSALARGAGRGGHAASGKQWTARLNPVDTSPAMWAAEPCDPFRYRSSMPSGGSPGGGELYVSLPLRDDAVLAKLQAIRQLHPKEARAVKELYFAPRAALAPFAVLFRNFGRAVEHLVQADESERWRFFVREVLLFEKRARIIAKHIAMHVRKVTDASKVQCTCEENEEHERPDDHHLDSEDGHDGQTKRPASSRHHKESCDKCSCSSADISLAATLLKHLIADENRPLLSWEDDSGAPPEHFQWNKAPRFSGGALAALLGVTGTGLHGEIHSVPEATAAGRGAPGGSSQRWEEMRGGLAAFGLVRDRWNCPVPTVLPGLDIRPSTAETREVVSFRNGFAWRNRDGRLLQGAEPFDCEWTGTLIVDCAGCYVFSAGAPCDSDEGRPGREGCDDDEWSVTLKRGQKTYKLLNHNSSGSHGKKGSGGPSFVSDSVQLHEGAYAIHVKYKQVDPRFSPPGAITRERTGFEVRYEGPQTDSRCIVVPFRDLVTNSKEGPMGPWIDDERDKNMTKLLADHYVPTLRDARRTYQRAFKAVLLAKGFCLSAQEPEGCWSCEGESEVEFLLRNGGRFRGTAYYRRATETPGSSPYNAHHAYLDFNLLPVSDPYLPPRDTTDSRVNPSPKRQAALFDTWERLFDYTHLRGEVRQLHRHREHHNHSSVKGTLWVMFREAGFESPPGSSSTNDNAADLALRHLRVDGGLKDTLLNYFYLSPPPEDSGAAPEPAIYHIAASPDLQDERWTTRLWHARAWAKKIAENFQTDVLEKARPALWAADDDALELDVVVPGDTDTSGNPVTPPRSGIFNLVRFVQYSLLGIDPDRLDEGIAATGGGTRLAALQKLNDGLRLRARNALLAFLCQMNRVPLPFGSSVFATSVSASISPRDLSDLLLQDVEARLDERASRIQDGIVATQRLVTRLRVGLEPALIMAPGDRNDLDDTWEYKFANMQVWTAQARRNLYAENWATWDELRALEKTEAGRFLTQGLKQDAATLAKPGRPVWFTTDTDGGAGREGVAPGTAGLELQQANRDLATLGTHKDSTLENLLLMATPDNIPRPTLLSVGLLPTASAVSHHSRGHTGRNNTASEAVALIQPTTSTSEESASTTPNTTDELLAVASKTYGINLPLWIESAIRLGTRFIRVAAAGRPPAFAYKGSRPPPPSPPSDNDSAVAVDDKNHSPAPSSTCQSSCCQDASQPPVIDEYYFWLAPVNLYHTKDAPQNADIGTPSADDPTAPAWEDPNPEVDETNAQDPNTLEQGPDAPRTTAQLLTWKPRPAIALYWACVHNGCLLTPKRSSSYVKAELLPKGGQEYLQLIGRCVDSLFFTVAGDRSGFGGVSSGAGGQGEGDGEGEGDDTATATTPPEISPPSGPLGSALGFRYDLASDDAIALPQPIPFVFSPKPPSSQPKGPLVSFAAYPRFVYFTPGAPLAPTTAFGAALAIAGKLRDGSCFPAALEWYRAAFDPLARDNSWALCSKYSAVRERMAAARNSSDDVGLLDAPEAANQTDTERVSDEDNREAVDSETSSSAVVRTRDARSIVLDSPCCAATADPSKQPRLVRSRAVLLEYLDTMLQWADSVADTSAEADTSGTTPTTEATQHALVLIEAMARLLGPAPKTVIAHPDRRIEEFMSVFNFIPSAPPLNPRLLRLYDQVSDRLSNLRQRQQNGYLAGTASSSSAALSSLSLACPASSSLQGAAQPYRFTAVYPKAVELAGLVRNLASSLTSAYERGDGEYLSALRASHERTLLELGISTAQQQWRAADWEVDALQQAMKAAVVKRQYFVALRDGGLISGEQSHLTGTETAMGSNRAANIAEGLGQVFSMIPDLATGVAGMGPLVKTELPIGTKMAAATGAAARVLNTVASISNTQAGMSVTQAGWDRRLVEWRHQAELAQIEIAQVKRQRLAAERRRATALRELNFHERQREHADEIIAFERDRNSRHALYLFLQRETAGLLRATFSLALRAAREAYAAFLFERVPPSPTMQFPSLSELWDGRSGSGPAAAARGNTAVHAGLMAGERLELALRRLERSYMSLNGRELELSKRISLRESFPREFVALRQHGSCEVELPESIFDADYPGHYLRRLRSVAVSVPCVAGMYTGVHCQLRLLRSSIRTEPLLPASTAPCCCCSKSRNAPCGDAGDNHGKRKVDPDIVQRYASSSASASAVATSHGQDDAGLFELSFRDERYLPFEYEGAVSRWRIELPRRYNLFDFNSLSDVVLSLNYTARDGGPRLRKLAQDRLGSCGAGHGGGACEFQTKALWRGFEVRREFPDLWPRFERIGHGDCDECRRSSSSHHPHGPVTRGKRGGAPDGTHSSHGDFGAHSQSGHGSGENKHGHCKDDCAEPRVPRSLNCSHTFDVPLRLRRGMFPFFPGRKPVRITTLCISVSLRRPCQSSLDTACRCAGKRCPGRHFPVLFVPPGAEHCREDWRAVECVEQLGTSIEGTWAEDGESACGDGGDYDDVFSCEIGDLALGPVTEDKGCRSRSYGGGAGGRWSKDEETYGVLRFPRHMGEVVDVWLMCGYEVVGCCGEDVGMKAVGKIYEGKGSRPGPHHGGERPRRKYFADDGEDG